MLEAEIAFIIAAVIIFIGFFGELLFKKTSFPDILFLIFFGVIIGPVLGIVSTNEMIPITPYLTTLSLMMILFYGGMEINISKILIPSGRATLLAVIYFVLVTIAVTIIAIFLFNMNLIQALMFGPMIAGTSSVVIIPISQKLGLKEETFLTLCLESSITDVLNIVFFFSILEVYIYGVLDVQAIIIDIVTKFSIGTVMGFGVGVLWLLCLYRIRHQEYTYISTIAVLILMFIGSEFFGGSGVLSALIMGVVIGNDAQISSFLRINIDSSKLAELKGLLMRVQSELSFLIRAFFFVFLGLIYDVSFSTLPFSLLIGIIFTGIDIAMRYIAVNVSTFKSDLAKDKITMCLLCGQGLAHATLSIIPLQYGIPNAEIYPKIVVTVIILTNVITSIGSLRSRNTKKT